MMKKFINYHGFRNFSESKIFKNLEKSKQTEPEKAFQSATVKMDLIPNKFERLVLKWSGKYKNEESIPDRISVGAIEDAKSRLRIRIAGVMMLGTIIMCGYYAWLGKKRAAIGDTINKRYKDKELKILEEMNK